MSSPDTICNMGLQKKGLNLAEATLMKRFRVSPKETLMVGDSRFDMEAGQRAGTLLAATTFGFGTKKELTRFKPDFWIRKLPSLLKLL